MCYFITLVVEGGNEASIASVAARHGRRAKRIGNPSVASILNPGEMQFLTTVGHCDCGTVLARDVSQDTDHHARHVKRLTKKGWSAAKIDRWQRDSEKAVERVRQRREANSPDSVELWINMIGDLLALSDVEQVGLLLHFYAGDIGREAFDVARTVTPFNDLASRLNEIRDGELLVVHR
jgi:hypothetical protein